MDLLKFGRKTVYLHGEKLRLGSRGKLLPAGSLFSSLPKGEARKLRKALRARGRADLAGAPRS